MSFVGFGADLIEIQKSMSEFERHGEVQSAQNRGSTCNALKTFFGTITCTPHFHK